MQNPHPLLPKFERVLTLTDGEWRAIVSVPVQMEEVRADKNILREGARPTRCCLVVEGLACSSKVGAGGKRQILAFHIPQDMPDLASLLLEARDCDTWAVTDCRLGYIEHRHLLLLCNSHPRLALDLWRSTLVDAAIHREWTFNVGQREGLSRVAHLFCEMVTRMEVIGRAEGKSCALPVTQEDLGEASGLSSVHVNRVIQELRRLELISFGQGRLAVHDWDRLVEVADFRSDYLHLPPAKAA